MINRKFTMSALSIVLSMAIMGGTTFAFFTDQAQSTNNTFSTGTADLQVGLDTGNENTVAFANAIDAPDYSGVFPGFSSNTDFWLKNVSSSTVNLSTVADLSNLVENAGTDLKNNLLISWNCDTDDNGSLGDNTPTSEFTVQQWIAGGNATLGTIASGNAIFCRMSARVPSTATNDIASESLTFDVLYDATQNP